MPIIDVQVIKGVFDADQKREIMSKLTDTMVAIEGEALRDKTWVRIREVNDGEWAIGGQALTAAMIRDLQGGRADVSAG